MQGWQSRGVARVASRSPSQNTESGRVCLDVRCDSALRVSCGLERLSDGSLGAAGAATSTPSLLWRRLDRCLRLMPGPVTAGDPVSPSVAGQSH